MTGAVLCAGPCDLCQSGLPAPVTEPATSKLSFAANVRPARGPVAAPSRRTRGPGQNAAKLSWKLSFIDGKPSIDGPQLILTAAGRSRVSGAASAASVATASWAIFSEATTCLGIILPPCRDLLNRIARFLIGINPNELQRYLLAAPLYLN